MDKYSMTCSCGDVVSVDAGSQEEAVSKMKEMWTTEMIAQHFAEKHPGQEVITKEQCDAMIDQELKKAEAPSTDSGM